MKQKIASFLAIIALACFHSGFAIAQTLNTGTPTTDTAPAEEVVAPPADTTSPDFVSIATVSAEETQAVIVWTTDELAYGFVEYGTTVTYGLSTPKSADAALEHAVSITNLTPGTNYHYRIVAEDQSGNVSYSEDRVLETSAEVIAIDSTPPEISQIDVSAITTSGATIGWITDELAQGKVEYGKTAEYGSVTALVSEYATEHSVFLAGLEDHTQYHYRIVAMDESGNETVSPDEIFVTDEVVPPPMPEPEPEPFVISDVEVASVGTSTARIIWNTNEPATSQVFYGVTETYASSTLTVTTSVASHEIKLTGLKPGTNYFYKVVSKNVSGQTISESGLEFNTLYQQKTLIQAPVISNVALSSTSTSTATIIWATDVPAGGEVRYGTTTAYRKNDGGHTNLLTAHAHPLTGLTPNTLYNFVAIVRDVYGNETIYENQTFRTLEYQPAGVSESAPVLEVPAESSETVTDETTEVDEVSRGGGKSGGGGDYSHTFTLTLAAPKLVKVEALDRQAMFVWNKKPPKITVSGTTKILTNVVIVRSPSTYPQGPTFGKTVYKGNGGLFTDANLENGKTYYYSVFVVNQFNSYSQPTRFKLTPSEAEEEVQLGSVPAVIQKNPIYAFPADIKIGDQNKQVEHLQVLLASEPSIYPEGLITGYFGGLTRKAITAFQKRHTLNMTGIVDAPTRKKLEMLSSVAVAKDKSAAFEAAFSRDLKLGSTGGDVSILQQFLTNAGVYPEALVTSYFGPLTQKALIKFQQEQNLNPSSGYFGPLTKKRMLNIIRLRGVSF